MKTIACILVVLLSMSCMTVKRIERNCDKFEQICTTGSVDTVRIETHTETILQDTVIDFYFPRDTVYLETPLKRIPGRRVEWGLINSKLSYLEAGLAWSTAEVESGVLKHYLESGDTILQIQIDNGLKTIETLRTELKSSTKYIPIKENTPFAKFCIKVFWVVVIIVVLGIGFLILKYKAKLLGLTKKLF